MHIAVSDNAYIHVGDGTSFNTGVHIVSKYGIEIGKHVRIGEYVTIRDQNHEFRSRDELIANQGMYGSPIKIENDVWIGRGCFIGPGVTIGEGTVVGANSVVVKSLPPFSIAVGAPARVIRQRGA